MNRTYVRSASSREEHITDTDRIIRAIEARRGDIEQELGPISIEVDDEGTVRVLNLADARFIASMSSRHADARLVLTDEYDLTNKENKNHG